MKAPKFTAFIILFSALLFLSVNKAEALALVTDTFTGTATTDLASHTADSGNTWTKQTSGGSILLDGVGGVYGALGTAANWCNYTASSTTFGNNTLCTATYNVIIDSASSAGVVSAAFFDSSFNAYVLVQGTAGSPWFIKRVNAGATGSSAAIIATGPATAVVVGHTYNMTFTCVTNGTTVILTANIFDATASTTIWATNNVTDTTYPAVNTVGIKYFLATSGGS